LPNSVKIDKTRTKKTAIKRKKEYIYLKVRSGLLYKKIFFNLYFIMILFINF